MSIYKKLLEVQKEVGAISKDSKNPFFKSKYFDINQLIEHVQPVLNKHGLVLTQPIIKGYVFSCLNDIDSTDCIESSLQLPELNDPQKLGSCITYYRRYTLASLLGLQAEDDDGNKASKPVAVTKTKRKAEVTNEKYNEFVEKVKAKKLTIDEIKKHYELSETYERALKALVKL